MASLGFRIIWYGLHYSVSQVISVVVIIISSFLARGWLIHKGLLDFSSENHNLSRLVFCSSRVLSLINAKRLPRLMSSFASSKKTVWKFNIQIEWIFSSLFSVIVARAAENVLFESLFVLLQSGISLSDSI